jgi:type III pantothenate kinase
MQCLAVDVGNTSTTIGVVSGRRVRHVAHIKGGIRDITTVNATLDRILGKCSVAGAIIASVVPADNRLWIKCLQSHIGKAPITVSHRSILGVAVDYPKPKSIGADRLANACGAVALYGAPAIVADFGTALTFDVISENSAYIGGVIAPGLPLMTEYLADRTALLPFISLKGSCGTVGRSTEGAMRIGAHIGYRGMVREIVNHLLEGRDSKSVHLCATGGFASWVLKDADMDFRIEPNLTLIGLGEIFKLNCET